jgi:DNA/RNA endonuclease YhcR with UshA esterase domain
MRTLALAMVLALASRAVAVDTVQWNEAEQHVGQNVTVEGRVLGIHCSPTSCLLAFDPTFGRFTAVVQARSFKTFPPESLDATFVGRKVRVTGTIVLLEKKPEIVLEQPEDIQLVVTKQERKEEKDADQTAVLDRIDEMLDRLDALAERLESTQARLEQLSQLIDDRAAQLADMQAAAAEPPPPPPAPSYGEAQPRPAYESLRTVKRGMTSNDVARLIGQPIAVESGSEGASTWYYGYGRSIMFDNRGRATSLSGFPAP